jgi:isoquinoline 1-oxidoreductase alpha subunit
MPLLWVIRDMVGLTGTKYGCGIGECGACTVHVNGRAVRSCRMTLGEAAGHDITTIEGLGDNSPVQHAWALGNVPECGFCQPGQIMQAAALLKQNPNPEADEIVRAMSGNICRCGTYGRILAAIRSITGDSH